MRSRYSIQHIQLSLYSMRVAKGELLRDVSFMDLAPEYRTELTADAFAIHHHTNLTVKRVRRGRRKVWRFIDKDRPW